MPQIVILSYKLNHPDRPKRRSSNGASLTGPIWKQICTNFHNFGSSTKSPLAGAFLWTLLWFGASFRCVVFKCVLQFVSITKILKAAKKRSLQIHLNWVTSPNFIRFFSWLMMATFEITPVELRSAPQWILARGRQAGDNGVTELAAADVRCCGWQAL